MPDKALSLAVKIEATASEALAGLEREMNRNNWPAEFREIMWRTVADIATRRASQQSGL